MIFERCGTFKRQAAERAAKAATAGRILLSWGNKAWGFSYANARLLYICGMLSRMLYAAQTWMPTALQHKGRQGYLKQFEKVQRRALIAITGAYRTTSTVAMLHEADVLPVAQAFDEAHARALARLRTVPASHPLRRDVDHWLVRGRKRYKPPIRAIIEAQPIVRGARLRRRETPRHADWQPPHVVVPADKETAIVQHNMALSGYFGDINHVNFVYSDGSRSEGGRVGAAAVWKLHGDWRCAREGLGDKSTIMRAELRGLWLAAKLLEESGNPRRSMVWCDSQAALRAVANPTSDDADVRRVQDLVKSMDERGWNMRLQWLPGHVGVEGNEKADEQAKMATAMEVVGEEEATTSTGPTMTLVRRELRKAAAVEFASGKATGLKKVIWRYNPEGSRKRHRGLCRAQTSLLTQIRTGHCGVEEYRYQRTHNTSPRCACGHPRETRWHVMLECPRWKEERRELRETIGRAAASTSIMLDSDHPPTTRAVLRFLAARFPPYAA